MALVDEVMKQQALLHFVSRTVEVQENLKMAMEDKEMLLILWATAKHRKEEDEEKNCRRMNMERKQFEEVMAEDKKTLQKMEEISIKSSVKGHDFEFSSHGTSKSNIRCRMIFCCKLHGFTKMWKMFGGEAP